MLASIAAESDYQ